MTDTVNTSAWPTGISAITLFVDDLDAGSRLQLTLPVDDVDAMCKEVAARGVTLLNGPMDRPWGHTNRQLP
ncbi:VOC family protein [Streptomyces sp. NPDC006978]|uniref:VOC family protein n=1 Tax=unclassified Streptomyces TaxID=2593676 RepID=UPI002AFDFCB8|nr:VOC family protein [Streptomyces sp. S584]